MTAPVEHGRPLAAAVVEGRLAACVNIVPLVESIYRWEGTVAEDRESLLVIKTTRAAVGALTELLRARHPYENFELVVIDIVAGSTRYLAWIDESVSVDG
ncbi:MAG: divalent-cation tolerance protein CutA [Solirubrobacteraceae bacterium]